MTCRNAPHGTRRTSPPTPTQGGAQRMGNRPRRRAPCGRRPQPPRDPSNPPPPPPPFEDCEATRPSEGCTSTQPAPAKPICSDSPELFPISDFMFTSVFRWVVRLLDQVIAACGSQNVGASPVWSSTGGPSETTATQPEPDSAML